MPYLDKQKQNEAAKKSWRKHYALNPERFRLKQKLVNRKLKIEIFTQYGGAICKCCKEDTLEFLSLDHINNDGYKERQTTPRRGTGFYQLLKKRNWPVGYQVLCMNCNFGKRYGRCPHEVKLYECKNV